MTKAERLIKRLREMDVDIPDGWRLCRTHAGFHMRSAGAWSWFLLDAEGRELHIGSQIPVTDLLREKTLHTYRDRMGDLHIDPPWMYETAAR